MYTFMPFHKDNIQRDESPELALPSLMRRTLYCLKKFHICLLLLPEGHVTYPTALRGPPSLPLLHQRLGLSLAFPLVSPSALSSSPAIQILLWLIPVNSTCFSLLKFSCHLYAVWICCLEMIACFICVFIRWKVLKAKIRISILCPGKFSLPEPWPLSNHLILCSSLPNEDSSICLSLFSKVLRRLNARPL